MARYKKAAGKKTKPAKKRRLSYTASIKKISRATGRPPAQIRKAYKGFPELAKNVASSKSIARSHGATNREIRILRLMQSPFFTADASKTIRRKIAKNLLRGQSFAAGRIVAAYVKKGQSFNGRPFKSLGAHRVPKGPRAGQWKFFYDYYYDKPITRNTARILRRETRAERIAQHFNNTSIGKMKPLWKFFTKSELTRIRNRPGKKPTLAELRRMGKRVAKAWGPKLYEHWQKSFGYNYP